MSEVVLKRQIDCLLAICFHSISEPVDDDFDGVIKAVMSQVHPWIKPHSVLNSATLGRVCEELQQKVPMERPCVYYGIQADQALLVAVALSLGKCRMILNDNNENRQKVVEVLLTWPTLQIQTGPDEDDDGLPLPYSANLIVLDALQAGEVNDHLPGWVQHGPGCCLLTIGVGQHFSVAQIN